MRETNTQVIDFYEYLGFGHLGFKAVPRIIMQTWLDNGHEQPANKKSHRGKIF